MSTAASERPASADVGAEGGTAAANGNAGKAAAEARAANGAAPLELEALSQPGSEPDVQIKLPLSPFASSAGPPISKRRLTDGDDSDEDEAVATNAPMRMVSWQDEVVGRDLVSVREFEPSEAGHAAEEHVWEQEKKSCCTIM